METKSLMKIGIIGGNFSPTRGCEGPMWELSRQLFLRKDLKVYLFKRKIYFSSPKKFYNFFLIGKALWEIKKMKEKVEKLKLDLLHFNSGSPLNFLSALSINPKNTKKIITMRGALPMVLPQYASFRAIFFHKLLSRIVAKKFDHFIASSNSLKESLIRYYHIPSKKITVIYQGARKYPCTFPPFKISSLFLLHVSNFNWVKNPKTLFKTFKLVKEKKKCKLVIVGRNWKENPKIKKLLKKENIKEGKEVIFTGKLGKRELAWFYSNAFLYFHPSFHETFGLPLAEAMTYGLPIVASNVFSIPEVVGDAGILVDNPSDAQGFAKAILEIFNDSNLRKKLKQKALKRAKIFTWENCAKQTIALYKRVLKER